LPSYEQNDRVSLSRQTVTELSSEDSAGEYPLIVPTLNKNELNHLLSGGEPTEDIYRKAESHADMRRKSGKSPFRQPGELRYPLPKE
jgi:hypothetical protein